jgi:hypothetical protein
MDLTGYGFTEGTALILLCHVYIFVYVVQSSFSWPDGAFFLIEMFTACDMLLQILKSQLIFYTAVHKM